MDTYPSGNLRVSDAERDRALSELSEHFQAGRLTMEEFQERSDKALRAKTRADLHALFPDLPSAPRSAPPVPAGSRSPEPARRPSAPLMIGLVAFTVFSLIGGLSKHHALLVVPLIVWLILLPRIARTWGGGCGPRR